MSLTNSANLSIPRTCITFFVPILANSQSTKSTEQAAAKYLSMDGADRDVYQHKAVHFV